MGTELPRFRESAINNLMRKHGLSRAEFAEQVGISKQLIGAWLSGWTKPRLDTLLKVCVKFGVTVDYFVEWPPEKQPPATEEQPKAGRKRK